MFWRQRRNDVPESGFILSQLGKQLVKLGVTLHKGVFARFCVLDLKNKEDCVSFFSFLVVLDARLFPILTNSEVKGRKVRPVLGVLVKLRLEPLYFGTRLLLTHTGGTLLGFL
jgi:hypothetical protein